MANPYRAVRQLERHIFRSVPERPEPMWQRDGNNAIPDRLTGRSLVAGRRSSVSLEGAQLIATVIYRPRAKKVEVVRVGKIEGDVAKPPSSASVASTAKRRATGARKGNF